MSESPEFSISTARPIPPTPVRLVQWPLVREPGTAFWILAASAGFSVLAARAIDSLLAGCFCLAALWVCAWRCWLPIRYDLGPAGVTQRTLGRQLLLPWSQFFRYEVSGDLILLIRDAENSPLVPFRAIYLHSGSQHEETLALLEYYLPSGASAR